MTTDARLTIEEITPERARADLRRAAVNRPLSHVSVSRYASEMIAGAWRFTGEAIKYDRKGNLIDGQHRLTAIVEAGLPVTMAVLYDAADDVQEVLDTGRKRTAGDALTMRGMKNGNIVAAAARFLWVYDNEPPEAMNRLTIGRELPNRILVAYAEEQDLDESAKIAGAARVIVSPSVATFGYHVFARESETAARKFIEALISGAELPADSPILRLRNTYLTIKGERGHRPARDLAVLMFKVWNYWITNKPMKVLKLVRKEKFPRALSPAEEGV